MDLNDLLAEVEGIGEDRFIPSKSLQESMTNTIPAAPSPLDESVPLVDPHLATVSRQEQQQPAQASANEDDAPKRAAAATPPPASTPFTPPPVSVTSSAEPEKTTGSSRQAQALLAEKRTPSATPPVHGPLEMVLDVELELTVELGKARIPLKDLMHVQPGDEFALDLYPGNPLQIFVNERLIAYGEALIVDGELAVKVTEILASPTGSER